MSRHSYTLTAALRVSMQLNRAHSRLTLPANLKLGKVSAFVLVSRVVSRVIQTAFVAGFTRCRQSVSPASPVSWLLLIIIIINDRLVWNFTAFHVEQYLAVT